MTSNSDIDQQIGGYELDRFTGPVDKCFICPICNLVYRLPVRLPCEHAFCKSCIHQQIPRKSECPFPGCGAPTSFEDCYHVSRRLTIAMQQLFIRCSVCNSITKLANLEQHENDCGRIVNCPVESCPQNEVIQPDMVEHLQEHSKEEIIKTIINQERWRNSLNEENTKLRNEVQFMRLQMSNGIPDSAKNWHRWYYEKPDVPDFDLQEKFYQSVGSGDLACVDELARTNKVDLDGEIPTVAETKKSLWEHGKTFPDQKRRSVLQFTQTAFILACKEGYEDMANLLLMSGANGNPDHTTAQENPLHLAASQGMTEVVKTLLIIYGADSINVQGIGGNTPLHLAVMKENEELVDVLVQYGADTSIRNDEYKTPMQIAKKKKNKECTRLLKSPSFLIGD